MSRTNSPTIVEQVRRNAVALISLVVALSSLGYNTWRNEQSEANRNVREATFQTLVKLGELQEVVFFGHYDNDLSRGNPRRGWAHVLTLYDLSQVVPAPVPEAADQLKTTWADHWEGLGRKEADFNAIDQATDRLRQATLEVLGQLH